MSSATILISHDACKHFEHGEGFAVVFIESQYLYNGVKMMKYSLTLSFLFVSFFSCASKAGMGPAVMQEMIDQTITKCIGNNLNGQLPTALLCQRTFPNATWIHLIDVQKNGSTTYYHGTFIYDDDPIEFKFNYSPNIANLIILTRGKPARCVAISSVGVSEAQALKSASDGVMDINNICSIN